MFTYIQIQGHKSENNFKTPCHSCGIVLVNITVIKKIYTDKKTHVLENKKKLENILLSLKY